MTGERHIRRKYFTRLKGEGVRGVMVNIYEFINAFDNADKEPFTEDQRVVRRRERKICTKGPEVFLL